MLSKVVLILDKRKELSTKYRRILEQNGISAFVTSKIEEGFELLYEYEPDLVLISDSIDLTLDEACKKIRMLSYTSRPIVITISKSDDLQDKLKALEAGADDYLSEPIDSEEFSARINAHLRRYYESYLNEKTRLPDSKISLKIFNRILKENKNWAALLIKINDFEYYKEIYGELAADKMVQTYTAIITSTLDETDYLGELAYGEFLILTNTYKAEHIASFLTYAFDTIVDKFYSDEDANQGYIILRGDDNAGKRITLVSTSIGIISGEYKVYNSVKTAINDLYNTYKLARTKPGSGFIMERPKISAADAVKQKSYNNKILIIEPDAALNLLLKTSAELQGYETEAITDFDKTFETIRNFSPALVILDAGADDSLLGLTIAQKLKKSSDYKNIKIIMSTVVHDKKMILNTGADLYLPKPYELINIFSWAKKLIEEYNFIG